MISKLETLLDRTTDLEAELESIRREDMQAALGGDEDETGKCMELLRIAGEDFASARSLMQAVQTRIVESREKTCEAF